MEASTSREIREAVLALPVEVRRTLLRVLAAPPDRRAEAMGDLWRTRPGGAMAELLIDRESDRRLALDVADVLKGTL